MRLDFGNLIASRVEGGIPPEVWDAELAARFERAHAVFERRREGGEIGFLDLPYASESLDRVVELADGFGQWFEDVVVLGIGGSALGAAMLKEALLGPYWNERDDEAREHFPRLHVLDNPDPHSVDSLLSRVDPARTLFNVVSKSGGTAETLALYLVARGRVEAAVGPDKARGHFLFTTDPDDGPLRRIGEAEGVPMLPVPPQVGGRFSVLSPVGLLPAAVCGIDCRRLLSGAAAMEERCRSESLRDNPAAILATALHELDVKGGRHIHVLMPYCDRLRLMTLWFQQLWAESLGKHGETGGSERPTGPTPLASVGATDQHSLAQLFMEGPHDKVVLLVHVDDPDVDVDIPPLHADMPALAYLGESTLGTLLASERVATAEALRRAGRPNATVHLPRIGPEELGQLVMMLQIATVYAGALYDVNPLDQPGVEVGKQLINGLMGRAGCEAPDIPVTEARWIV